MAKDGQSKLLATSVAAAAAAAWGKRNGDRDALESGTEHDVRLQLYGTVNGEVVSIPIDGSLDVGFDNPSGSTQAPDIRKLLCIVWDELPKTRREKLIANLSTPEAVEFDKEAETYKTIAALIKRLSSKHAKRGPVSFVESK